MKIKYLKNVFVLLFLSFQSVLLLSQTSVLTFTETTHDFGQVPEELGTVEHTFHFKNTHSQPVNILRVAVGCGCTATDYTKEAIAPNADGFVTVRYSTSQRPGPIAQSVGITTDVDGVSPILLNIRGEVISRKRTKLEEYPVAQGNLRFKSPHIPYGVLLRNETATRSIEFYNNSTQSLELKIDFLPDHLTCEPMQQILAPKSEGMLTVTYDASQKIDWGLTYDHIGLLNNDTEQPEKFIHVSADIVEDFSGLTLEELKNAPDMVFAYNTFNFDTINEGEVIKHIFEFKNTGKRLLVMRKMGVSCGCTASNLSSHEIEPNETGNIEVNFNSLGKKGYQRQNINIINNNPHNPVINLVIEGYVIPKK